MTSMIKACALAMLLALPSLANATFFTPEYHESRLQDFSPFTWSGHKGEDLQPQLSLGDWFQPRPKPTFIGAFDHKDKIDLTQLLMELVTRIGQYDFGNYDYHKKWERCHTSEVPVPAALPLFSMALLSLGLFKRRR